MKPHTPENWDAASAHYDANITDWTAGYASAALEAIEPAADSKVLEVAAGGGALTLQLAPLVSELTSVDYSQAMLDLLQPKLVAKGLNNVTLAQMNGMALDIADAQFDHAFSQFGVMLFDDPQKGLSELCRALVPGGTAAVTAWAGPDRFESFGIFVEAVGRALPDLPKPDGPPPIFSLADPELFTAKLHEAGFSEARVEYVTHDWQKDTADEFIEMFKVSAPPARELLNAVGPEAGERLLQAMRDILTDRFGDGPITLKNTATLGVATK